MPLPKINKVYKVDFSQAKFSLNEWQVDPQQNTLLRSNDTNKIEKRLIRVLVVLANHAESVVTKEQLLQQVWQGKVVSDETISVAISKLRKALGCNAKQPSYIETISGVGFRLLVQPKNENQPELESKEAPQKKTAVVFEKNDKQGIAQPWYKSSLSYPIAIIFCLFLIAYQNFTSSSTDKVLVQEQVINNESYAKALFLLQKDIKSIRQAEILLTKLNKQQPNNALILNALGKAKYFQYWYTEKDKINNLIQNAEALFLQSITIDPDLGDAHLHLALINMIHKRNFTLAEEYFINSIALNPEQVITHIEYAGLLLSQRRFDEAVHHNKIAQSIDPKHYSSASIEWIYNMAEQYPLAEKELAKLFTIDPESTVYNISALRLAESQGEEKRAYIHYEKSFIQVGYTKEELQKAKSAFELGGLKQLNYWLANIKKEQHDIGQYGPPVATARYHIGAGEYEKALTLLEQAHTENSILTLWFNSDPKYAPLRALPRFQKLIKNIEKTIH